MLLAKSEPSSFLAATHLLLPEPKEERRFHHRFINALIMGTSKRGAHESMRVHHRKRERKREAHFAPLEPGFSKIERIGPD